MLEYNIDVKWRLNQDKYNLKYLMSCNQEINFHHSYSFD